MTKICQDDLIQSIADALQYISYYHPADFLKAMGEAWEREENPAAKDAMAQILVNSRMCAEGRRPVCQDTGMVVVFLKIGMQVQWQGDLTISEMVNEGVRHGYAHPDNVLRFSMVSDPLGQRKNTLDNTPAIVHTELVSGDRVEVKIAAKGGGSENKSRFKVLNPSDSLVDWVLDEVPKMGAGWCPPGMLGIGVGGSAEQAMLMAKESLMEPIDIHQLMEKGPSNRKEELRLELFEKVNALGIGAQGLGGLTTVLDVKISDFPTHAASLPVGMIPNCAATRHVEFTLDGSGPAELTPPAPEDWPDVTWEASPQARRINLDTITREEIAEWQPGDLILLSGKLLTGRDAAHKRIADLYSRGEALPDGVDFHNRFIYYVGPVDPVRNEVVGPAGPTTATRMDKFSEVMLGQAGLLGMVGKAERGPTALEAIKQHKAVYLMAVGGAAYLVSKAIRGSKLLAFEDLGMEAIREFEVVDFPVTVAVDSRGTSIHKTGPAEWREKIGKIPVITE
jgi:fumarate hydratase class I